ncbi:hypothetical protein EPI10_006445 [Gossypium australe]|uniref:Uncharacterized protein n=1 Tax=Gossypium australe TaxID=47621 RepID=A0A5B6WSS9_9ROSI|nr:hypothetical protein EPI10_006445 [Gossypium australe]
MLQERVFETLAEKVKILEEVKWVEWERRDKIKASIIRDFGSGNSNPHPIKRANIGTGNRTQECAHCGKPHQGECWKKPRSMFEIWISRAPNKGLSTYERTEASTTTKSESGSKGTKRREGHDATNVMTGFTPSCVAYSMSNKMGIMSVYVNKIYRIRLLKIQGGMFLANLMELPFGEFDLILGMDWLKENQIIMIGEHWDYVSSMISTLVAEKLVRKGCEAYLAYILDTNVDEL